MMERQFKLLAMLALCAVVLPGGAAEGGEAEPEPRPWVEIRAIYGGIPTEIFERGKTLADYGVNAVWMGSGEVDRAAIETLKAENPGVKVFAEFNTMHWVSFLRDHPDAAPIGPDGARSPAPNGWQGICPTHPEYRRDRMDAFRATLKKAPIDGIWLDYHHAHASWERAEPLLPDTCFCPRCLETFARETGVELPRGTTAEVSRKLLTDERARWIQWRCDVFTDWVREFRESLDATRPGALLGTFHCPWTDDEHDGALKDKLAIDLKAQAAYLDVFSIMPYHARFGHAQDVAWISRQTEWLGRHLGIKGVPGERLKIWPIVQVADWDEPVVPVSQVRAVLDHGTRAPSTGAMVFFWPWLHPQWDKVEEMGRFYKAIRP